MTDSGHYIHGTEPEEQRRLARLNDLLNAASADALALESQELDAFSEEHERTMTGRWWS